MTPSDARRRLKVSAGATESEIKRAHRKAAKRNHPDHGGSTREMADDNEARDQLLKELRSGPKLLQTWLDAGYAWIRFYYALWGIRLN